MSFILDSLKKSEQQRRRAEKPGLHGSLLGGGGHRPPKQRRIWPLLILLALLVNAGLLFWFVVRQPAPQQQPEVVHVQPQTQVQPPAVVPPPAAQPQPPAAVAPLQPIAVEPPPVSTTAAEAETPVAEVVTPRVVVPAVAETSALPAPTPNHQPAPAVSKPSVVPLDQLEPSVRAGLPPLQLSLHYYAPGTGNSMVRLDGVILREGDELQPGLLVDEIVADGVILSYKGRLILLHRPRG